MNTEVPGIKRNYLKPGEFQDNEIAVTYLGWDYKPNEDIIKDGKIVRSWKDGIDYIFKYSFPEFAKNKVGEPILDDNGQPRRNSNWKPEYPHGYSIVYHFEEGSMDTGSMPFYIEFFSKKPKPGEVFYIKRTGVENKDKKWSVRRPSDNSRDAVSDIQEHDVDEFGASTKLPF